MQDILTDLPNIFIVSGNNQVSSSQIFFLAFFHQFGNIRNGFAIF